MTATTTTTLPLSTTARPLATRIATVVRLLLANPWTAIYWPLIILTVILLMNMAIWGIVRASITVEGDIDSSINGGVAFLFIYMLVVAVQSVNQAFPLALGYGSTRRDFVLGFGVFAVVLSFGYSVLLVVASLVERATSGWGIGLTFFTTYELLQAEWWEGFALSLLGFLLFIAIGASTAAVYVRWKAAGMYVFWGGLVFLGIGGAALATWLDAWPHVGAFLEWAGVLGAAAWSLILTALCALAAWLILRRATPNG